MIEICALASGSNGNCYHIGNHHDAILIDLGISHRQLMERFLSTGLSPHKVKAVFISHEHIDHIRGMQVFSKRHAVNVYMTSRTYYAIPDALRPPYIKFFQPGETVEVGSFSVHTFSKSHDAIEPASFRVEHQGKSVGVFTDIGEPCQNVNDAVSACHALFMETNYDEDMLWKGRYPWPLKKRVASSQGHLSNNQALELVTQNAHAQLECIFLSHISKENNTPQIALNSFDSLNGRISVKLTSRFEAGEVYRMEF